MKWTPEQQRKYRAQVKMLRLTDEQRRDLLERLTGKRSTSEIGGAEMQMVLRIQAKMLGRRRFTQDDKVRALEKVLGWNGQPARLGGFIRRQTGGRKFQLSDLTPREKSALIEGLKGVIKSLERKRSQQRMGQP